MGGAPGFQRGGHVPPQFEKHEAEEDEAPDRNEREDRARKRFERGGSVKSAGIPANRHFSGDAKPRVGRDRGHESKSD